MNHTSPPKLLTDGSRNLQLDGLRGVAVLLVTLSHANVPVVRLGGTVGVTLFFVLSGYLITSLLLDEKQSTGRISLRAFYARRVIRLLPALLFALAGGSLLAIATGSDPRHIGVAVAVCMGYIANLGPVFEFSLGPFGQYWSLSMEEQFYFVWPLLLLCIPLHRVRWVVCGIVVCAAMSLITRFWGPITIKEGYRWAYYLPHNNAWAILMGCAAAFLVSERRFVIPKSLSTFALIGLLFVATVLGLKDGLREQAIPSTYVVRLLAGPLAGFCGVILVLDAVTNAHLSKWLVHPFLLFFGKISYALYLWHGTLDDVIGRFIGSTGVPGLISGFISAGLGIGIAVFSWHYVEQPFLKLKHRFKPKAAHRGSVKRVPFDEATIPLTVPESAS